MADHAEVDRWRRLARVHADDEQWQRARFLWELALDVDPRDPDTRFELARAFDAALRGGSSACAGHR